MSLLTDISIKAILGQTQYTTRGHPFPSSRQPLLKARAVADAEHSLALKTVAEWLDGTCTEHWTESMHRRNCTFCISALMNNGFEGKMPGEE